MTTISVEHPGILERVARTQTLAWRHPPIPYAALLALVMIAAMECAVAALPVWLADEPPFANMTLVWKNERVQQHNDYEMLVVGDCFATSGLIPPQIEADTGLSCMNLGVYVANTYIASTELLTRYLESCRTPPKVVVLVVTAESLTLQRPFGLRDWETYVLRYVGRSERVMTDLDWRDRLALRLSPPCLRHRDVLARLARGAGWNWEEHRAALDAARRNFEENLGYVNVEGNRTVAESGVVTHLQDDIAQWHLSILNEKYLLRMLDLCEQREIDVVLCSNTLREDVLDLWKREGVDRHYHEYLTRLAVAHPCVRQTLDFTASLPDRKWYRDNLHLCPAGSKEYTRLLSKNLAQLVHDFYCELPAAPCSSSAMIATTQTH